MTEKATKNSGAQSYKSRSGFCHDRSLNLAGCLKRIHDLAAKPSDLFGSRQGCQIFLDTLYQNGEKYQMNTKYPKWSQNISNGHKISQMVIKYVKWS
jgi:hypothetical protein